MRSAHHVDTRRLRYFNGIDSEIYTQVSIDQYIMADIRVAQFDDFIHKQVLEIIKLTSIFHHVSCLAYKRHFLSRQITHSFVRLERHRAATSRWQSYPCAMQGENQALAPHRTSTTLLKFITEYKQIIHCRFCICETQVAFSKLQTVTLFRPIRSLQCSW